LLAMTGEAQQSSASAADPGPRDAEELAREREAILSQLHEAVILADADGSLTFVNAAAERLHGVRLLGVGPDEYSDRYHLLTVDGLPYPPHDLPLARAVRGETVVEARWRIQRPDGSIVLAVGSANPILDASGKQIGSVLTARDETERDRAERQVRENEARLRALTDNLPGGAVYQIRMRADGTERRFTYLSQSYERLAGVPVSEVLADPSRAYAAILEEDRALFAEAEEASIRTMTPFDVQARFRRADGETLWCRFISAPREQGEGWIVWDGLQIDITSRVKTQIALSEMNAALEKRVAEEVTARERVWTVIRDLFVISSPEGLYRSVNPAWQTEMGYDPADLVGMSFDALVHPDDRPIAQESFATLQAGTPISGVDIRIRAQDGSYRWYSWTCFAESDGFFAAGRDITQRKELEEQLRQSQKMEAVGQLTGGIAHDFNNLLTIIRSAVDMMRHRDLPEQRRVRYVDAIAETVDRASRLTGQLLAFARRHPLKPETLDIAAQLPVVADLVRSLLGPGIALDLPSTSEPLIARLDLNQFETALMNLFINARDAMNGEGRIAVALDAVDAVPALGGEPARSGNFVAIAVSDSGRGIPPDQLGRIFEPFFTTKEVGRGTGLGLSQVFGFVRQSGGNVAVASEVGRGTTFTLYLPRIDAQPEAARRGRGGPARASQRTLRVLVVEDDEQVGLFSTETLHDLGHRTTLVRDGASALAALASDDLHFDVVFSDVMMPGMTGIELAHAIRERHPGLPVLLTSGYSEILAKEGTFGFPLLSKPYSVEALSRALRKAVRS
jgi:PAS domain S-box-containing protein